MKIEELVKEMAVRGGNLQAVSDSWAERLESQIASSSDHKQIGKIDDFVVKNHLFTYTMWDSSEMIFAARVDKIPGSTCTVDDVWTKETRRGLKLFTKFLLWLKVDQGQQVIRLGEIHSDDTYNILKSGGFRAFKKHWENFHGETAPFSTETIDSFYGKGRWKLVLENSDNLEYLRPLDGFTRSYGALINVFNNHDQLGE